MDIFLDYFIRFFVPPIVGAFIGYVTNKIAITMIFRPYKEIRLFKKIRLPFTPGLIPKERYELAHNIGEMVEKELLTPEVISQKLQSPEIELAISDFLQKTATAGINKNYALAVDKIASTVKQDEIFNKICDVVENEINKYVSNLGGMVGMLFASSGMAENLSSQIPTKLLEIIDNTKAKALETENSEKIIKILQEKKDELDFNAISKTVTDKLVSQITEIMAVLDIKQLVEDRINSLDIREVEKILLVIVDKHLKWINLFGALLGAMIGLVQVGLGFIK